MDLRTSYRQERFSVTTSAGAKIQPHFDVPAPTDPNVHLFTVIGEIIIEGQIRCWVIRTTLQELQHVLGTVNSQTVTEAIQRHVAELPVPDGAPAIHEPAEPLDISAETYALLKSRLPGVNDDHCFQLLVRLLRQRT